MQKHFYFGGAISTYSRPLGPQSITEVRGAWIFIGFIAKFLTHLCLTKASNISLATFYSMESIMYAWCNQHSVSTWIPRDGEVRLSSFLQFRLYREHEKSQISEVRQGRCTAVLSKWKEMSSCHLYSSLQRKGVLGRQTTVCQTQGMFIPSRKETINGTAAVNGIIPHLSLIIQVLFSKIYLSLAQASQVNVIEIIIFASFMSLTIWKTAPKTSNRTKYGFWN